MTYLLLVFALYLLYLICENLRLKKAQKRIKHIIHVNGTRGKSSVTRLIGAGLSAGGYSVMTKTTGTLPTIILPSGEEEIINRHGPSNIKEQIRMLLRADKENADILVIECMALKPEYQKITQHRILNADIGVITNVRLDHTEIMGNTVEKIAKCLANTLPKDGICFTNEENCFETLKIEAEKYHSKLVKAEPQNFDISMNIDFAENYSLALAVCEYLGVEKDLALGGMVHSYRRDSYAIELYRFKTGLHLIAGLSINDRESIEKAYYIAEEKYNIKNRPLVLLINNRSDRGARTLQMADTVTDLKPRKVWILGSGSLALKRKITGKKQFVPDEIKIFKHPNDVDFDSIEKNCIVYAIGNLGEQGIVLMDIVRKKAEHIEL